MATTHQQRGGEEAAALRKEAGAYLKKLREKADLTQNDLARFLGFEYYTMISQIEAGRSRVPPDKMQQYAESLKVDPQELTKMLLRYYDPYIWQILFGGRTRKKGK